MAEKKLILEKALELFAEKGYYRTTIEEISYRADLKKLVVYKNIHSKEELFMELLQTAAAIREEEVFKNIDLTEDLQEKLSRFMISLIRFARNHRSFYRILVMEVVSDNPEFISKVTAIQNKLQERIYQILQDGVRQERFRTVNPLIATTFFSQLIAGTLEIIDKEPNYSSDQIVLSILDLLWNGLGKK